MRITINEELAEQSSAKEIVWHLILSSLVGWILSNMLSFPFPGVGFIIGAILYLCYLGYKMAYIKSQVVRDERVVTENTIEKIGIKQAQLQELANAIKQKADATNFQANALKEKAIALEAIATDNEMLGKERQLLSNRLESLGRQLANAKESEQTLKQTHDKEVSTLLVKLELAEKEALSMKKALEKIKKEEEERGFIMSVKGSWSSFKKDKQAMDEKFGVGNWEHLVKQ